MAKVDNRLRFFIEREHQRIIKYQPEELCLSVVQATTLVWLHQLVENLENNLKDIKNKSDSEEAMRWFVESVRLKDCINLVQDIEIPFDESQNFSNLETTSDEIPLLKNESLTAVETSTAIDYYSIDKFFLENEDFTTIETSSDIDEPDPEIYNTLLKQEKETNSNLNSFFDLKVIKASSITLLLILEEAHENQANIAEKRGDAEQAMGWFADKVRLRDVINLVTTIDIPFNENFLENEKMSITKTNLELIIQKEMEDIAYLYNSLELALVQARCLIWLSLLAESHEDQANDAEKRGDAEQAMGWFADAMRIRDAITLVNNIDIPFANISNTLDERKELKNIFCKYGTKIHIPIISQKKIYTKDEILKVNKFQKHLRLLIEQERGKTLEISPNDLDLYIVQARILCWLALLAEAHEDQANDAEKRGDAEQAMGWFADSMRLRDVINLVTSIEIPLPDNPDSLDENDELLDGPTILPK